MASGIEREENKKVGEDGGRSRGGRLLGGRLKQCFPVLWHHSTHRTTAMLSQVPESVDETLGLLKALHGWPEGRENHYLVMLYQFGQCTGEKPCWRV